VDILDLDGIYLPGCDLWLDPHRRRELAVVSHAHSDHVRRHAHSIATAATADLAQVRYRTMRTTRVGFASAFGINRARVTLYPAGHVLGSAQVLVEEGDCRLLYSGDLRLRASLAAEPAEVPRADVLIMESTFGLPRYVFPPPEEIEAGIIEFCEAAFARSLVPVFFVYALGKAQEAAMLLASHGVRLAAHRSILEINAVYRRHGVAVPDCADLEAPLRPGTAILCPPGARVALPVSEERRRTAVLTGWAMDAAAKFRYRTDAAFPLSDHCGFDDLMRYVELVGARDVRTVHGFAREFAQELQRRGVSACPLTGPMQLALPGLV